MKTLPLILTGLALSTTFLLAEPEGDNAGQKRQKKAFPIIAALDADADGVISADEIENAAAALATLDKNGDGQLTRREVRANKRKGMRKCQCQKRRKGKGKGRGRGGNAQPEEPANQ